MECKLDSATYNKILDNCKKLAATGKKATAIDMDFLSDDDWLVDSAVLNQIRKRKGGFEVYLVFAWASFPFRMLVRRIDWYTNERKALLHASFMTRVASKDPRGTLTVSCDAFNICIN